MTKTALYTIFRCTNYGAVLQAYALARTLRGILGDDAVDVINHRMDPRDNHLLGKITNPNTPWLQRWRNKRKFAARYFHPELFEARRAKTVHLIDAYIRPTTKLYKCPHELKGLPPYATVVVGSDQIWNPGLNHDFGHNQYLGTDLPQSQDRVAYAASFGVSELPEECIKEYGIALSRFRRITVREESGAKICSNLLSEDGIRNSRFADGVSPQVVLDPTLLLSSDEWLDITGTAPVGPKGRYVAAYWVRTLTQSDVAALGRISKGFGAPICLMSAGPLPKLDFPPEVAPYIEADPFDFVRTIANSHGTITDSFHGLQFSTLFKKPFLALGDIGNVKSNASRLVDFCARHKLSDGVQDIEDFRGLTPHAFADFADYSSSLMDAGRSSSLNALKEMLS